MKHDRQNLPNANWTSRDRKEAVPNGNLLPLIVIPRGDSTRCFQHGESPQA